MIVEAILTAFLAAFNAVANVLPDWSLPTTVADNNGGILYQLAVANRILPIRTMITVLGIVFTVQGLLKLWDFSFWIYHQFWGTS